LSTTARGRARTLFRRLAEAEAAIHDVPIERVHLHEVGALDSIIDIVGASFAIEWMRADRIVSSPLNLGSGMVDCAHGRFPVPAPATARLVAGVPVYASGPAVELTTPTGALLVTGHASSYGPLPQMAIERIGYGAGARDLPGSPNVLRVIVGEATEARMATGSIPERVTLLEFETDDMNPQLFGPLMESLQAAGALDVFYTAVQMKKNRPGTLVTVIAPPERRVALAEIVFRETTTLGVRYHDVLRDCLAREERRVETPFGRVRVKVARLGGRVVNAAPEFEDCLQLARQQGAPVKDVQAAALKAWLDDQHDESTNNK
jgi:pyridinium-3,5-bisthiocarboxylic acid mononucleotide nickel chelatase